ncbi:MAG: acyl-CoA synthetase [Pseudomonadota bacterium]
MKKHFNIADLFELVAGAVPEREALVCGDKRLTFNELDERSNRFAHYLQQQGVGAGDHVGLYLYNCNEYIEAMFACFKLRAVPININYRYVGAELSYIFDNAQLKAVVHHREFVPVIEGVVETKHPIFERLKTFVAVNDAFDHSLDGLNNAGLTAIEHESSIESMSPEHDFGERSGDDLFILYTGGTTGMPKGVMWPHEAVFFAAMNGAGHFHPDGPLKTPEEIVRCKDTDALRGISLAPLMHGASWWYSCIQLLGGNTLVLDSNHKMDSEQIWRTIAAEKVNMIQIVGDAMAIPLLEGLANVKDELDLSNLFSVGSGGAVFSESKQRAFKENFPNCFVTNNFGSSESGQMGTDNGSKKTASGLGNFPRSEVMDVLVEQEDGSYRHAEKGETGIVSRSGYIPVGYYNDPEKTAKTFIPVDGKTWLLSGDAALLEEDDTITIFGRGSNCINSGGEKIFPEEVEQALKENPAVCDALVVATPHERWGSQVSAVVSLNEGQSLTLESLQDHARKLISSYKLPRLLCVADEIQRSASGKPDYKWALDLALKEIG